MLVSGWAPSTPAGRGADLFRQWMQISESVTIIAKSVCRPRLPTEAVDEPRDVVRRVEAFDWRGGGALVAATRTSVRASPRWRGHERAHDQCVEQQPEADGGSYLRESHKRRDQCP